MESINVIPEQTLEGEPFTIRKFLQACAVKWKWFVISVIVFTGLALLYVMRQQPKYERTMSVLIKDNSSGGGMDVSSAFSSMGLVSTNTNVYNELISLQSPAVMSEVVADLKLTTGYTLKGFPHPTTLYGTNQPFEVKMLDLGENESASFQAKVNPDGTMTLVKFRKIEDGDVVKLKGEVEVGKRFATVNTPIGRVQFLPNPRFSGEPYEKQETIIVSRSGFLSTVENYTSQLKGDLADRDAEVINLSMQDVSKERADDILNMILKVYTENWIQDKNRISAATSEFINERLSGIEGELGQVDNDIMVYKKENHMPDLYEAGKLNLLTSTEMDQQILDATSKLSMAKYVAEHVDNPANAKSVIPVNTGGVSPQLETQIASYNNLLLARNNLAESTSENNPIVRDYDAQLKGMHESIAKALNTQVVTLANALKNMESAKGQLQGQLSQGPEMARHLRSVERQQKVKEQLYIYLLQKREENQLTQKFTADNTRVITPPTGPVRPVSPKKGLMVAMGFLFGLAFPGVLVYVQESSNTKVRSRKDLERMATPFLGEIPFYGKKPNKISTFFKKNKKKNELEKVECVVKSGSRDLMNESIRIVRGNLDFMTRNSKGQVVMVTSFNPGSGKSFITFNLCAAFAIKGKKVLLIDCDLRHGSASQYVGMPSKGISNYLTGASEDWRKFVVNVPDQPGFSVLPIGHRPPNPAELLDSQAMRDIVEQARKEYDIVFMDCPPVDVVVDTQILGPLANRTIFVVRAGLFEKSAIADADNLYKEARFNSISILLNGTEGQFSRYGGGNQGYYGSQYAVKD